MMKFLHATLVLAPLALALASCAPGGPIRQLGLNQYVVSHNMGKYSPVKGVRQGVIDRAVAKCASQGKTYHKIREEMGMEGSLSYNLIFECQPATATSK